MSLTFEKLHRFISNEMRMSHVYQPVMLQTLLARGGRASVREIAEALLNKDEAQLSYYEEITRRMPGDVLRKRGIVEVEIYVCDRLVLPRLGNRISEIADGSLSLDRETRVYVSENLGFRWLGVSSPATAFAIERGLQAGKATPPGRPLLNPQK